jgi:lipid II:glycine glycyltransferase (peptidoglycan interpeptide bridge formation enzyme)
LLQVLKASRAKGATVELAVAEHAGEGLAVHILIAFGDTVTYAHGASSSRKRELMAPHLLQWASMTRAKTQGFTHYDFFGVAPAEAPASHPWAGITRFKEGFGGQRVSYPGAYDFVLNAPGYWLYTVAHQFTS